LGLDYFGQLRNRLARIFSTSTIRVPTGFQDFDEFITGGFPPYSLNILAAKIHAGKSNTMANFAARQVMMGYNVALLTLEMSQDAFSQRMDGIFSCLDINKIYSSEVYKRKLIQRLKEVKEKDNRGILFIKEYPTGRATVLDFKAYLRELKMRNICPDIIYVDYVNLMKSALKSDRNMYEIVKSVSEELRALSFDFNTPVVSVSQLNRDGTFVHFKELDYNYIAESMGLAATSDFMAILGLDEDSMVYQNEMSYKITKNRHGGRVGQQGKMYIDTKSLKMYDSSETDLWLTESEVSGDDRELHQREERIPREPRGRGRRSNANR
jgi:replicative DNA helicase